MDTMIRAVPKVVNSSSIMVRPRLVSVSGGRYSVISLQTFTHVLENRLKIRAPIYRKKIRFRRSTTTVAIFSKNDGLGAAFGSFIAYLSFSDNIEVFYPTYYNAMCGALQ